MQIDQPIFVAFTGHDDEIKEFLEQNYIFTVRVLPSCTDELQPMDFSLNESCKSFLRDKFNSWYADEVAEQIRNRSLPENVKVDMGPTTHEGNWSLNGYLIFMIMSISIKI